MRIKKKSKSLSSKKINYQSKKKNQKVIQNKLMKTI